MKRNNMALAITVPILVLIDQAIKIVISRRFFDHGFSIIGDYVLFRPKHNTDLSWINSWLGLGVGFIPHVLFNVILIVLAVFIYRYSNTRRRISRTAALAFILFFAAAFCSLIDKVFWPGSLDYIYLKDLFTFDLKDVYATVCEALLIILVIRTNSKRPELLEYKAIKHTVKDFFKYVRDDIVRSKKSGERKTA